MNHDLNIERDRDRLVGEFVLSHLPDEIRWIYRVAAGLNYPIVDLTALEGQVKESQDLKEVGAVLEFFSNILVAGDFPLKGAHGTLEILALRLRTVIPWLSTPPTLNGINLLDDEGFEFPTLSPCSPVVLPVLQECLDSAGGMTPFEQMLHRMACYARWWPVLFQCNEEVKKLGAGLLVARFDPCVKRAVIGYAECVAYQLSIRGDPSICLGSYKASIYRCGRASLYSMIADI